MTTGSTDYRSDATRTGSPGVADVKDTARQTLDTAKREAMGLGEELKNQGAELVGAARARAQGLAEEQKAFGADQVDGIARAASKAADELEQASPQLARYVRDAASAADNISTSLRERSIGDILQDVTDFARREPVIFFGLTVAAGFALSRFLKSSGSSYGSSSYDDRGMMRRSGPDYGAAYEAPYARRDADAGQPHTPVASTHATPAEFPTGRTTTTEPMGSESRGAGSSSGIGTAGVGSSGGGSAAATSPGGTTSSGLGGTASATPSSGTAATGSSSSPTRTTFPSGTSTADVLVGAGTKTTGGSNP
jgi:hypothetical protein